MWTFPIKAPMLVNETYELSLWARPAVAGTSLNVGMEALFGEANVSCPAPKGQKPSFGQCSYTPQAVRLPQTAWTQVKFERECRFDPDHSGYNGAAGMVSIELVEQGVVWVDDLKLALKEKSSGSGSERTQRLKSDDDGAAAYPLARIWPQPLSEIYFGNATLRVRIVPPTSSPSTSTAWRGTEGAGPALRRALAQFSHRTRLDCSSFELAVDDLDETLVDVVDESYALQVSSAGVALSAPTVWGARHGLDSLAQLVRGEHVRHARVADRPEYAYRGLMVSPGQRFMTMGLLKTHLDAMEIARMNVLHFHLSEFCAFRVESRAFPELAANLSGGLNAGFYSWADIRALVSEAKQRGIRVIPEYDVPGHQGRNAGLLRDLQWCSKRPPEASQYQWEIYDDPAQRSMGVLTKLIEELVALFPDRYFHVGGDEIKSIGPCTTNGSLFSLEQKVLALLKRKGKVAQGWSELLLATDGTRGHLDTVINAWQGDPKCTGVTCGNAANVTARGYRAINSNSSVYYLGWNPISFGDIYIDIAEGVPRSQRHLLLGGEVSVWTAPGLQNLGAGSLSDPEQCPLPSQ